MMWWLWIPIALLCKNIYAQSPVLTLHDAVAIGLENNYQVKVARNDEEAARYSRNIGNAGMLPVITGTGSINLANNNINQELSNGTTLQQNGVRADAYNGAVNLTWTLFDGLTMFATYGKLTAFRDQGALNTRIQAELTIQGIMQGYYDVVRLQQLIKSTTGNIDTYRERLKIAEAKLQVGTGNKIDVLQARVDLNTQESMMVGYQTSLYERKLTLNQLMGREITTEFEVSDTILLNPELLSLEKLRQNAGSNNASLLFQKRNIDVARYTKREISGLRFPRLNFNASYVFARSVNQAGFFLVNQNLGFNGGFSVSWNIFDSWRVNTQKKVAKLAESSAYLQYDNLKLQVDQSILLAWRDLQNSMEMVKLEEESIKLANENVEIALERFRQGQSSTLEIKEAQRTLETVQIRLTDALFQAKSREIELLRLTGGLISSSSR